MTTLFNYNQEQAIQAGGGQWVLESGGFDLKITRAAFTKSQSANSRAEFLELDVETREGAKCNYISICYTKGDGTTLDFGHNGFKFELKLCANVQTGQTMKEFVEQKQALSFADYASSVVNKDERKAQANTGQSNGYQGQQPTPQYDDDINF